MSLQRASTLIFARMAAGIAGLDEGEYIEGHYLDAETSARVPKNMIGKRLSARQAKKLLDSIAWMRVRVRVRAKSALKNELQCQ